MTEKTEKELAPGQIDQAELQKAGNPGLFANRLKSESVVIGEMEFTVNPIPANLHGIIVASNVVRVDLTGIPITNHVGTITDIVRYGLADAKGVRDLDGNPVTFETQNINIAGKMRRAVKQTFMDGLPLELIDRLSRKIQRLGEMTKEERERLGFTSPSSETNETQNAT